MSKATVPVRQISSPDGFFGPFRGWFDLIRWKLKIGWRSSVCHVTPGKIETTWVDRWSSRRMTSIDTPIGSFVVDPDQVDNDLLGYGFHVAFQEVKTYQQDFEARHQWDHWERSENLLLEIRRCECDARALQLLSRHTNKGKSTE